MTDETLTPEHAAALLRAYGAQPENWPASVRLSLGRMLEHDPGLQQRAAEERALDERLAEYSPTPQLAVAEVLARVEQRVSTGSGPSQQRASLLEQALDWLCFAGPASLWRGAVAAALTMVVGFGAGAVTPESESEDAWAASEQSIFMPFAEVEIDG